MDDPIADVARATAARLGDDYGPRLAAEVEAELHRRDIRERYVDPLDLAALIVAAATLAWAVYTERRKPEQPQSQPETIARTVRLRLSETRTADATVERVVELAVTETLRRGGPDDPASPEAP